MTVFNLDAYRFGPDEVLGEHRLPHGEAVRVRLPRHPSDRCSCPVRYGAISACYHEGVMPWLRKTCGRHGQT